MKVTRIQQILLVCNDAEAEDVVESVAVENEFVGFEVAEKSVDFELVVLVGSE